LRRNLETQYSELLLNAFFYFVYEDESDNYSYAYKKHNSLRWHSVRRQFLYVNCEPTDNYKCYQIRVMGLQLLDLEVYVLRLNATCLHAVGALASFHC
jgi:hypothetical protein